MWDEQILISYHGIMVYITTYQSGELSVTEVINDAKLLSDSLFSN